MGSPVAASNLTLKCQSQGQSDFEASYLVKEQELGSILLLNTNRKSYMRNARAYLNFSDLEMPNSRSLRSCMFVYCKEVQWESNVTITFDLELS